MGNKFADIANNFFNRRDTKQEDEIAITTDGSLHVMDINSYLLKEFEHGCY